MIVPNKYCPMGMQQGIVCKGEMCMWFNPGTGKCEPLGAQKETFVDVAVARPDAEPAVIEEKPKKTRGKKDAALTQ